MRRAFAIAAGASFVVCSAVLACSSSTTTESPPDAGPVDHYSSSSSSSGGSVAEAGSSTSSSSGAPDPCFITTGSYTIHDDLVPDGGKGDAAACPLPGDRTAVATPTTTIPPTADLAGCTRTEDKSTCTFTSECVSHALGAQYFETIVLTTAGGSISGTDHTTKIPDGMTTAEYDCEYNLSYIKK
jgi:hypothetical protein